LKNPVIPGYPESGLLIYFKKIKQKQKKKNKNRGRGVVVILVKGVAAST
jgi:hypothetical protein